MQAESEGSYSIQGICLPLEKMILDGCQPTYIRTYTPILNLYTGVQ